MQEKKAGRPTLEFRVVATSVGEGPMMKGDSSVITDVLLLHKDTTLMF